MLSHLRLNMLSMKLAHFLFLNTILIASQASFVKAPHLNCIMSAIASGARRINLSISKPSRDFSNRLRIPTALPPLTASCAPLPSKPTPTTDRMLDKIAKITPPILNFPLRSTPIRKSRIKPRSSASTQPITGILAIQSKKSFTNVASCSWVNQFQMLVASSKCS